MSLDSNLQALATAVGTAVKARIPASEKGTPNGVATLDGTGKIPSAQLPSYVDDVVEYANMASFPATGSAGILYIDLATNKQYRWGGSAYQVITSGAVDSVNGQTGIVTIGNATTSVAGLMSGTDKTKLDGVAAGAQVNVATNLGQGTLTNTTIPLTSSTGTGTTLPSATTSLAGLMSGTDKTKLDGIAAGAQVNVATNISEGTRTSTSVPINSSTGTGATLSVASTTLAGTMSAADKSKLDGIATGANAYVLSAGTSTTLGGIKLGSDTVQTTAANAVTTSAAKSYALQLDSSGKGIVNVPWTDTTYSNATTSVSGLMSATDKTTVDNIGATDTNLVSVFAAALA